MIILFCPGLQLRELWGDVHNQPGSLEVWNVEGWVNLHLHKSSLFLNNIFLFYLKIKKYLEKHSHLMLDATDQRFSNKTIVMHCIITNKREQKKWEIYIIMFNKKSFSLFRHFWQPATQRSFCCSTWRRVSTWGPSTSPVTWSGQWARTTTTACTSRPAWTCSSSTKIGSLQFTITKEVSRLFLTSTSSGENETRRTSLKLIVSTVSKVRLK